MNEEEERKSNAYCPHCLRILNFKFNQWLNETDQMKLTQIYEHEGKKHIDEIIN